MHEHPIDDDELAEPVPTDVPPVPGSPPGLPAQDEDVDEDPDETDVPISPAAMDPG